MSQKKTYQSEQETNMLRITPRLNHEAHDRKHWQPIVNVMYFRLKMKYVVKFCVLSTEVWVMARWCFRCSCRHYIESHLHLHNKCTTNSRSHLKLKAVMKKKMWSVMCKDQLVVKFEKCCFVGPRWVKVRKMNETLHKSQEMLKIKESHEKRTKRRFNVWKLKQTVW